MVILVILLVAGAYLLGSIPSAVWIGKRFYGIDIREHGSKNAGTTNTLRVLGRRAALPVFALDVAKGYVAVTLAQLSFFEANSSAMYNLKIALCVAAILGHILPIFASFKGGKGVATLAGSILAVYPSAVLLSLAVFLVVLATTHYVSLGSMIGGVMFPISIIVIYRETDLSLIIFSIVIAILLIFTHRKNIKRLKGGTESKIYIFPKNIPDDKDDPNPTY